MSGIFARELLLTPLHLTVAGAGLVGKRHVTAIAQVSGVELVGIVDPAPEAGDYATSLGVPLHDSLDGHFSATKPDGVILATPTPLHVEQGLACIRAGIPVLIEKPIAVSAADAEPMVAEAEAAGVPILVGHHRRHNPLIQKAKKVIESGRLGDIRAVYAQCWFHKPTHYFDEAPWRKKRGAGPISVNLVHDVDLLRYLCGEINDVQSMAAPSLRGYENEDTAAALLRFENGAIGTLTVSDSIAAPWSWEHTSREHPVYPVTNESCYRIGGTLASLSIPDMALWSHVGAPDWWSPISAEHAPRPAADPLVNQIAQFAEVIRGEAQPLVSGREGLETLKVIEVMQDRSVV